MLLVEPKMATAHGKLADEVRRRINKAAAHLETALVLWRQHTEERAAGVKHAWKTHRRSRKYGKQSRPAVERRNEDVALSSAGR